MLGYYASHPPSYERGLIGLKVKSKASFLTSIHVRCKYQQVGEEYHDKINVPSKIELLDNLDGSRIVDSNGSVSARINIYTYNVLPIINKFIRHLLETESNPTLEQGYDNVPTTIQEIVKHFIHTVLLDRNHTSLARRINDLETWSSTIGLKEPEPPAFEPYGTFLESIFDNLPFSPHILAGLLDNIGSKKRGLSDV